MKTECWLSYLLLGCILLPIVLFSADKVQIGENRRTAVKLLLRQQPSHKSVILYKLPEKTLLALLPEENLVWAKVLLPEEVFLWVPVSCIRKDHTLAGNTPFRMGPGAFYPLAGKAEGGEKVLLYEKSSGGIWQKIRLKRASLVCYCLRKDLVPVTVSGEKTENCPEKGEFFTENAVMEGLLYPLSGKEKKEGWDYALAVTVGKVCYIRAYLRGDTDKLARWKNRNVKISGKKSWRKGMDRPVFKVEKIEPAWSM
ncbi:MAG: hypothetical protein IKA79_05740 [Lentisphaeria bacterium]|nr:hypothetical protein [Lentisphaeria bacterium]